ncbi:MAG TPA: DUF262 domain-containing protein [Myxococcota bacterium]|nr:DUF262 domain-containing protein [Myxococcota bacterium]
MVDESHPIEDEQVEGETPRPFDPSQIRVKQVNLSAFNVHRMLEDGAIDLAPDFQRKAGLWDDKKQSRLIESLMIRIPLPAFYLEEDTKQDHYIAVDGIQRLTAIRRFMVDRVLKLRGLEYLTDLDGKTYDELPRAFQRRVEEANLSVYVIERGTPSEAKLNIFKRINTGGLALTAQEIRHAMNPGPIRELLRTLAESEAFKEATDNVNGDRMADREMIARFLAFRGPGRARYPRAGDFDAFINDAMAELNRASDAERDAFAAATRRALRAAHEALGDWAFRRPARDGRRSPVNKALFEAVMVAVDAMTDDERGALIAHAAEAGDAYRRALEDQALIDAVTAATGDVAKVERRFSTIDAALRSAL